MRERADDAAPIVWFVDRSLGGREVPAALRAVGAVVETHDAHFSAATPDTEWLGRAGERGWVVLTKDEAIRRRPLEMAALLSADVAAFILTARNITGAAMAATLVDALPRIARLVRSRSRPMVATIAASGAITIHAGGERRGGVARK